MDTVLGTLNLGNPSLGCPPNSPNLEPAAETARKQQDHQQSLTSHTNRYATSSYPQEIAFAGAAMSRDESAAAQHNAVDAAIAAATAAANQVRELQPRTQQHRNEAGKFDVQPFSSIAAGIAVEVQPLSLRSPMRGGAEGSHAMNLLPTFHNASFYAAAAAASAVSSVDTGAAAQPLAAGWCQNPRSPMLRKTLPKKCAAVMDFPALRCPPLRMD
jgi:hypothetical protein